MGQVIGDVLPLAVGVALSPIPIIAAILLLLSPRAKATSTGFAVGWLVGIVVAVTVFALLGSVIPEQDPDEPKPIAGTVQLLLGLLLLMLAWRQWRSRPKPGEEAPTPGWMASIDSLTAGRALVLGATLSAVNPKNLVLCVGAGVAIGTGGLDVGGAAIAVVVFALVGGSSVVVPVVAYRVATERMAAPLERLRAWLVANSAAVMAVVLLVLGVALLGKGIGSF